MLEFPRNARTDYTAVKTVVRRCDRFCRVKVNDDAFIVTAAHGMLFNPFGQNVKIIITATGTDSTRVLIQSVSRILFGFGSNTNNVRTLGQYISNEVWKLLDVENNGADQGKIRIVPPNIKMR